MRINPIGLFSGLILTFLSLLPLPLSAQQLATIDLPLFWEDNLDLQTLPQKAVLTGPQNLVLDQIAQLNCPASIAQLCTGSACQVDVTSCLEPRLADALGRTFAVPGPNCFATALKITGHYPSFRGVDEEEFRLFIAKNCRQVQNPQSGDIGTYAIPDYGFSHAFVYMNKNFGVDKPGVDYSGKSRVAIRSHGSIKYTHGASPECYQYAPDPTVCSNVLAFYRCSQQTMEGGEALRSYRVRLQNIERDMADLLNRESVSASEKPVFLRTKENVSQLRSSLSGVATEVDGATLQYLKAQVDSLEDQIKFFENAFAKF